MGEVRFQKQLVIERIETVHLYNEKKIRVEYHLRSGQTEETLWYTFDAEFERFLCLDRCDPVVTLLFQHAMRVFDSLSSEYPISEELYYNLTYHVIPQMYETDKSNLSQLRLDMPITQETYHGPIVATGMSRGVDSFATMYEYGDKMSLEDHRINAFTYFQVGAHHGFDSRVGRSEETRQELFEHQMVKTREFCEKYGYPLIVAETNIHDFLNSGELFSRVRQLLRFRFYRSHTTRNVSVVMLLQKGISKYYYSSAHNLGEFKLSLNADSAEYEKWLLPYLSTGSVRFYSSNQNWTRMEKVERIVEMPESYDYLQVCLVKSGNCGKCVKCKRTLMELDALGDEMLELYRKSFDVDTYRKEDRSKWFGTLLKDREKGDLEAQFLEELLVCAAEHHPELLEYISWENTASYQTATLTVGKANIRSAPSLKSKVVFLGEKGDSFRCLGESCGWVKIEMPDKKHGYIVKKATALS